MRQLNKAAVTRLLAAGLVILACVSMAVGAAFARYQTTVKRTASLSPGPLTAPDLKVSDAGWTAVEGENAYSIGFEISNPSTENDLIFRLQLYASQGFGSSADVEVEFSVDGYSTYTASASAIKENSPAYRSFGAGWVYEAYDGAQPWTWTVPMKAEGVLSDPKITGSVKITYDPDQVETLSNMVYLRAVTAD